MKKLAFIFVAGIALTAMAQVTYWFQGFQRQPSAAAARAYLFQATNNPSAGDALRWNGTNLYWSP